MSRTAKIIAGLVLIGVAVGIATGWFWSSTATATERVGERIDTVQIDNDSGNVEISTGEVTTTQVRQSFSYRLGSPDNLAFEVDGGTLRLGGCGWWCSVDYVVVVPEGTTVTGTVDSGNISLTGVSGVEVDADSGNIELRDVTGPLTVEADSGNITGSGLDGNATVQADSGNIELQFSRPADVTADVDSGNIDLVMPDGPYEVVGESDSGERNVQVATDPSAEHILRADLDSGDLSIMSATGS
ncbi:MAG: DUF4097 family beta strand repeat-containing protein [Thermocrispum sp.]